MNFITAFKAERLIQQIRAESDLGGAEARKCLKKLSALGAGAIPKILEALGASSRSQTDSFVEVLSGLLNDKTLPLIAQGLTSDDPSTVSATTSALRSSTRYNVNQLVNMLGEDEFSKPAIVEILSEHKERLNVGRLLGQVGNLEPNEQAAVFRLIGEIATDEALPGLLTRLDGRDAVLKSHLLSVISMFDCPEAHKAIREQLKDGSKMVRRAALAGVAKMKESFDVEAVCELLLDSDIDVMNKAADVIVEMNRPDTAKFLLPALKSDNEFSRRSAVEVLNEIGTTKSVKYLLEAVADDDWWVRSRASDALARIGGPRVVEAVLELIKDEDENVRRAAIEIINTCADPSAVDHLIDATRDSDWWVSERAADALAGIGNKRAVPALLDMLARNDRSLPVAIKALGKLGDSSALKQLLPYVRRPEKEVSIAAIVAVSELADERLADGVTTFLQKSVNDSTSDTIRCAIEKAIENLNKPATAEQTLMGNRTASGARTRSLGSGSARSAQSTDESGVHTLLDEAGAAEPARASSPPESQGLDIASLEQGDIIDGRYKFIEKIGKGAFGTVLLVEDTVVQERLILKFLNPNVASDEEMMKRFVHELRYSRRITHKNVIRIYDFLYIGGGYAISMEYFPSHTLGAEIARENPMNPRKAVNYALDICTGMFIAHQQGIIHRDLKPANILINDEGLLKIVDFGVAAAASSGDTQLTKTGYVIGSPKYMAPEQILGKKVDERADIYSLGVILYEMLCGSPPYSRGDHMSVMYQHVQGKAAPLHEAAPDIPRELCDIVTKSMMVDKSKRFATMMEFHEALAEASPAHA